ncbi:MAG: PAS domain S-box protein, partial [Alphaproteobacteria bacterium]|nr:PAS domain S-box protein [Alphaproteobacteria bacterium]
MSGAIQDNVGYDRMTTAELLAEATRLRGRIEAMERDQDSLEQQVAERTAELQGANELLAGSEARFRDVAEAASDWFWEMDGDLRISYVSEQYQEQTGIKPEEVIGKTRGELILTDEGDENWQRHLADLGARRPFRDFRATSLAADGRLLHASLSGKPLFDSEGEFLGYRGIGTDITAQVEAEKAHRESEALLRRIIDNSPSVITLKDTEGRYLLVNKAFTRLHGCTPEAALGKTYFDFTDEQDAKHVAEGERQVMASGEALTSESMLAIPDGSSFNAVWTKFPAYGANGELVGVGTITTDITEQKRADEAAAKAHARLLDAIETISEGFVLFDSDNRLVLCNQRYREMFAGVADLIEPGITYKDLLRAWLGRGFAEFPGDDLEAWLDERAEMYLNPPGPFERQYVDGRWILVEERRTKEGGIVGVRRDITAQKQAEAALRESEERFRSLFEHAGIGMVLIDSRNKILQVNQSFADLLGYPQNMLVGMSPTDITHPDDRRESAQAVRQWITGETWSVQLEKRYITRSGDVIWGQVTVSVIAQGDDGKPIAVAQIEDITDRRRAEKALRESEARFRAILDHAPMAIFLKDVDGRFVFINKKNEEWYGFTNEEAAGRNSFDFFPADVARRISNHDREVLGSGEPLTEKRVIPRADGSLQICWIQKIPLRNESGEVVGLVGMTVDVTEQKRAEQALRGSEARFRDFAETASDWLWETDTEGRFTFVTDAFYEVSGLRSWDLVGKTRREVYERYYGKVTSAEAEGRNAHLDAIDRREAFRDVQVEFSRPDGSRLYFLTSGRPVFDESGEFQGYRGTAVDVTDRKRAEQEIGRLNESLERRVEERTQELRAAQAELVRNERLAMLGQLSATVSHELRNPLGTIRASTFSLGQKVRDKGLDVERPLQRIERNVERCSLIIDEMLEFARFREPERALVKVDDW